MKTVLIEKDKIGGVALNTGNIPSKALLESAHMLDQIRQASKYGLKQGAFAPDWPEMVKRARIAAERMSKGITLLLGRKKVEVIKGTAILQSHSRVEVASPEGERIIEARDVIYAGGVAPKSLPGVKFESGRIINPRTVLDLPGIPRKLVIYGAGAIGVEYACLFSALDTQVVLVSLGGNILPGLDEEVSQAIERILISRNINIITSARMEGISRIRNKYHYFLDTPEGSIKEIADVCLINAGVSSLLRGTGLRRIGVGVRKDGSIKVDDHMRSSVAGVYAVGDCIGPPLSAAAAAVEGLCAAETIGGVDRPGVSYSNLPSCIYCRPEVASVGLTEKEAVSSGYKVKTGKVYFVSNGKAATVGEKEGFVKLVVDTDTDKILGAHIVGLCASELIGQVVLCMEAGITAQRISEIVHAQPTLSEVLVEAAGVASGTSVYG